MVAQLWGVSSIVGGDRSFGKGGDIEIKATNVEVLNGFQIDTATFARGDAGNLKIAASDSLRIDGANQIIETYLRLVLWGV